MKLLKKSSAVVVASSLYLATAIQVLAVKKLNPGNVEDGVSPIITPAFNVDLNAAISWAVTALGIIAALAALFWLILGAIKWIISGGDKEKVAAARGQIIAAIIGLIIVILSFVILNFVIGLLVPGASIFNLQIPTFQEAIQE